MGARPPEPRGRRHPEAARRSSAHCTGVPQYLLRRHVESRLPDRVSPLQRERRHGVRTRLPASETAVARRCFAPAFASPRLESQLPIADFDVLAFSVSFEWDYTNVLTMLRLSGLPLRAAERDHRHPLVVLGGATSFLNPEPLAPFVDVVCVGEGEVLAPALVAALAAGGGRQAVLERLAREPGMYVPSLVDVRYDAAGCIAGFPAAAGTDVRLPIAKASLARDGAGRPAVHHRVLAGHRVRLAAACRGRPRLRQPVPLLLGGLQLPARPRLRGRPDSAHRRDRAPACLARRPGVDRALRPSRDRAHPQPARRAGLPRQPRLAPRRRPHRRRSSACSGRAASEASPSRQRRVPTDCAACSTRR